MAAGASAEIAGVSLATRFAWITGARLILLTLLLGLLGLLDRSGGFSVWSFTMQTALATLGVAFVLTAVFAGFLRRGHELQRIVKLQLISDQLIWTIVVYLSGASASGATSFYGLSCLTGAILAGFPGATLAGVAAGVSFLSLLWALHSGWIQPPPDQPPYLYHATSEDLIYSGAVNLLVIIVVVLLAGYLSERLRRAGGRVIEAERRADEAERLAALGRLAAGLAHEIRNPLGSIIGSIQLLRDNPQLSSDDKQLCNIIQREGARLNDLVTDMIDLSRPRQLELARVDVVAIVRDVARLASQSGRAVSDVEILVEAPPGEVRIMADGARLRQLVWNLVRNAVQASNAGSQVIITVTVSDDQRAELIVRDFGIGLDSKAKARIFDAFFTTRSQGTGIGLAVVKRIADDHGFAIDVDSDLGRGAVFRVKLGKVAAAIPQAVTPANG
jgi:signal transduction histidine kinase